MKTTDLKTLLALWVLVAIRSFAQDLHFESAAVLPLAEPLQNAFRLTIGDVNRDGSPDVVAGSAAGVVLLLAQNPGQFAPGRVIPVPVACPVPDLVLGDFDRDGLPDLAVYCPLAGKLFTYRGAGDGTFSAPSRFDAPIANAARGLAVADLDQDGVPDLVLGQDGKVAVLIGNGDGNFHAGAELNIASLSPSFARPVALTIADFNGDGIPDIATANLVDNDDVSIFLGLGGGSFAPEVKLLTHDRPHDIVAVDFDGDGNMDLAVPCDSGLLLFSGDGHGAFRPGPQFRSDSRPLSVAVADLNGDGLPDFAVGNYYGGSISVVLNSPDGTLRQVNTIPSIGDAYSVALADLNGDSLPDVVASSYSGSSALFAAGRGAGNFDQPVYFGAYPANSFLTRKAEGGGGDKFAVVLQGRRLIHVVDRNSATVNKIFRDDYPLEAVFADLNGDGIEDLALITVPAWRGEDVDFHASIRVLPGLGDGRFDGEIVTPIDSPAQQGFASLSSRFLLMTAGDFDGDGVQDLAIVNQPLQELQIYRGNGDGTFALTQRFPAISGHALAAADFNGDGVQDLATLEDRVNVYLGNRAGDMIKAGSVEGCQFGSGGLGKGDFNGDGAPDLLLNCESETTILLNVGGGSFQAGPKLTRGAPPTPFGAVFATGDFDGDGKDDIAVLDYGRNSTGPIAVMLSDGTGSFRAPFPIPVRSNPIAMAALDFDGDGALDLLAIDASDGSLRILRNQPPGPAAAGK